MEKRLTIGFWGTEAALARTAVAEERFVETTW
jgi:hypothetical protein